MRRPPKGRKLPPAPRLDPNDRRAEAELFEACFDPLLWRRPAPL